MIGIVKDVSPGSLTLQPSDLFQLEYQSYFISRKGSIKTAPSFFVLQTAPRTGSVHLFFS
jgi:hypothetical protein